MPSGSVIRICWLSAGNTRFCHRDRLALVRMPLAVVVAIGAHVTTCQPGDRLVAQLEYNAYAEQIVGHGDNCFVIPDSMPFKDAVAMGLAYPSWKATLLALRGTVKNMGVIAGRQNETIARMLLI